MIDPKLGIPEWTTMNQKSIEELGFFQVLKQIEAYSLSDEGKETLRHLGFVSDEQILHVRQDRITAFRKRLGGLDEHRLTSFPSIGETLLCLADPLVGAEGAGLVDIADYIRSAKSLLDFCSHVDEQGHLQSALLPLMGENLEEGLLTLAETIEKTLDRTGQVLESHPRLLVLRMQMEKTKSERSRFCSQFIHENNTIVQSDKEALRDGRLVIPVRNDHRSIVKGFVTATSQSGSTVFMEPYALVEMNNSVVMAQNQIIIEIAKIMKELNDAAREQRKQLERLQEKVGTTDAFLSLAKWSVQNGCTATLLDSPVCNLMKARHPLLGKKAIPISIQLDPLVKAVVISGPNAGGKTVTIKTIGLFALLNQFCAYLPVSEGSSLFLVDDVFTDIGDEQSIEQELSTFSAHMKQIGSILNAMTERSLVILDELGSGTDPVEGSAIARATLEYCLKRAKLTLVTSHHGVLKQFAYAKKEVINASMEFNEASHLPTFRVIQGLPGESHAIDTAKAMKLPKEVVEKAEEYLGSEAVQIGSIIQDLEAKRRDLERKQHEMASRYHLLQQEVKEVQLKELRVRQKEMSLKQEQTTELSHFMAEKRKELERLVKDLRSGELDKTKTRQVKAYVQSLQEKLAEEDALLQETETELAELQPQTPLEFQEGMDVLCGSAKRPGKILKKQGKNKYLVALGSMRMTLDASQLFATKQETERVSVLYHSSAAQPKLVLDVRGCTLEEALAALDTQIESALVHGMNSFSIIHGYGDGILSRGISEYLKQQHSVREFHFALPEDGGMGKTYVEL